MNRRAFLGGFCAASAAIATAAAAAPPQADTFTYRHYNVRWAGWREPANQAVMFGVWYAVHQDEPKADHHIYAATTLGVADRYYELDCLDTTRLKDWPVITGFSSDKERAAVKERARLALLRVIDDHV